MGLLSTMSSSCLTDELSVLIVLADSFVVVSVVDSRSNTCCESSLKAIIVSISGGLWSVYYTWNIHCSLVVNCASMFAVDFWKH